MLWDQRGATLPQEQLRRFKTWQEPQSSAFAALDDTSAGRREDWFLHKFQATFGTTCLRNGIDLQTVQHWIGHKDLESTKRYLKPHRNEEARKKNEAVWAAVGK